MYSFSTENWIRAGEAEVAGSDGDDGAPDRGRRRPSCTTRGSGCASSAAGATPVAHDLIERMEWAEETDPRQHQDHAVRGIQLRRPGGDRRRSANLHSGTEDEFRAHLYAPDMHDPDLIIRTSGEQRISNYLLWQGAYSEWVFRDELWPDFSRESFEQSLEEFAARAAASGAASDAGRAPFSSGDEPRRERPAVDEIRVEASEPAARRRAASRAHSRPAERQRSDLWPRILVAVPARDHRRSSSSTSGGCRSRCFMIAAGLVCMYELYRMLERWRPVAVRRACSRSLAMVVGGALRRRRAAVLEIAWSPSAGGCCWRCDRRGQPRRRRRSRLRARCSASTGSGSRSPTPSCCASLPHGNGGHHRRPDRDVRGRHRRVLRRAACSDDAPSRPGISPNKTVEGLFCGMLLAILAVFIAGLYQTWLTQGNALAAGT